MGAQLKHATTSLEQIASIEGTSERAIHPVIRRALKKLRRQGPVVYTARDLALELERSRAQKELVD
jgi:hypothetical protein